MGLHCSEADTDETQHELCPRGPESWCKYHLGTIKGTTSYKKSKTLLPKALKTTLKPIFIDLSKDSLLEKCLHGKTQNNNECLNNMLWCKCPKSVYVGRNVMEMGASSAIICFNDGVGGIINVITESGLDPGVFTARYCKREDDERMSVMDYKSKTSTKFSRKKLRNIRKGFEDKNIEKEGDVYGAGLFE